MREIMKIYKYMPILAALAVMASCNDSEGDLLEPKAFFESEETTVEIDDQTSMSLDLRARLSKASSSAVTVTYELAGGELVDEYNKKRGTDYLAFDASNASFSENSVAIARNELYAKTVSLNLSNVDQIEEGKSYVLPVRIKSASVPMIGSEAVTYYVISKPTKILKVFDFYGDSWSGSSVYVPLPVDKEYTSVTYEVLIYMTGFNDNNTVMGHEGTLILRIGDEGGGLDRHLLQIAGNKQYNYATKLVENTWYHVAFVYDQPSGKTAIYINGEKGAESTWDTPSFKLGGPSAKGAGFFIGKVAGFMWGERPFKGYMSEARIWETARTEKQINQNMLSVDPKSEGLVFYYKFNDQDQERNADGQWIVKDASGHGMDGIVNGGSSSIKVITLDSPVKVN